MGVPKLGICQMARLSLRCGIRVRELRTFRGWQALPGPQHRALRTLCGATVQGIRNQSLRFVG